VCLLPSSSKLFVGREIKGVVCGGIIVIDTSFVGSISYYVRHIWKYFEVSLHARRTARPDAILMPSLANVLGVSSFSLLEGLLAAMSEF
jgi:hypothetical protein